MRRSGFIRLLTDHIISVLQRHGIHKEERFVIGVSGGPDSMVMMHAFIKLNKQVIAAHVNYKKRAQADRDEDLVRSFCEENKVECIVRVADPHSVSGNFQNWARDYRRDFLKYLKLKYNAIAIVTAHHKDDQIETVMQKILRGSSLSGWMGIQEFDGTWLRPFLGITKSELLAYPKRHSVPYATDHTNLESEYARNFIRNEWRPELNRLFPGWEQNILRLTERAEEYEDMIEVITGDIRESPNRLNRSGLLRLKPNVRKAVILSLVRQSYPDEKISASALDNIDLEKLDVGQANQLSKNLLLICDRHTFTIMGSNADEFSYRINIAELEKEPLLVKGYQFSVQPFTSPDFKRKLYLNLDRLSPWICFRAWRQGDRFQPFGFKGTKKVSDFLNEKKVEPSQKKSAGVIITSDNRVNAVLYPQEAAISTPGAIDERVRCEEVNHKCLVIERITRSDEA